MTSRSYVSYHIRSRGILETYGAKQAELVVYRLRGKQQLSLNPEEYS
jgi:hypothetical protein